MKDLNGLRYDFRRVRDDGKTLKRPWRSQLGPDKRTAEANFSDYPVSLKWALKPFKAGPRVFIEMVRAYAASVDRDKSGGEAQRLVDMFDKKMADQPPKLKRTGAGFNLDDMCAELGISVATAYGWFSEMAFEHGLNIMRVNAAINAPMISHASIEKALDVDDGGDERRTLFEAMGFLPTRKGTTVAVQQNNLPAPSGSSDRSETFESQQRRASQLLRQTPIKTIGQGSTVREVERVSPSNHPSKT